jgi:hypothetical protein
MEVKKLWRSRSYGGQGGQKTEDGGRKTDDRSAFRLFDELRASGVNMGQRAWSTELRACLIAVLYGSSLKHLTFW